VTDRELVRVPFAALRVDGQYLIERHAIALAPTVAAVNRTSADADWTAPVVVGDPVGDLPAARIEATEVAARLGVSAFLGAVATRDHLRAARRARVLHVASHMRVDPTGPLLRFADGDLGAAELLGLRLAPRVAVLATCASAAGDDGDPWRSVASALLAAGAHGVVATIRSVADADARALVLDFYDAGGAVTPALALATAQRRAIARGAPTAAWAVFVYLGSAH
jgi:CHAT domain-containing protein